MFQHKRTLINPLPGIIEIKPVKRLQSDSEFTHLIQYLEQLPEAESVQLDSQWIKRLRSIMLLAERGVFGLTLILALGVLLIIGNTIRLATLNRIDEIMITQMLGATDAFIRRPFIYTGILYGLCGSILASVLILGFIMWLQGPVQHLAGLYQSSFMLKHLGFTTTLSVIGLSSFLGLMGAWVAVNRQLKYLAHS